ncbi:MAG: cytochrome P450, partial [Acidimicrobiaceae bacterium]|nr:cytochrome P450 [Acidimicrobiaceae bacterium]
MQDLPHGTIDVDHQAPAFVADRHNRYAALREQCPVVFNQHYGGFWMVTDYESVAAVARDNETFAHKYEPDAGDGISYHGICGIPRPPYVPRMGVSEIDGPEHADLRRVLNPLMTPRVIERQRPRMEAVSSWFIDQFVEAGAADLVLDYATPVPAVLTLEMMGMDAANWRHYAD